MRQKGHRIQNFKGQKSVNKNKENNRNCVDDNDKTTVTLITVWLRRPPPPPPPPPPSPLHIVFSVFVSDAPGTQVAAAGNEKMTKAATRVSHYRLNTQLAVLAVRLSAFIWQLPLWQVSVRKQRKATYKWRAKATAATWTVAAWVKQSRENMSLCIVYCVLYVYSVPRVSAYCCLHCATVLHTVQRRRGLFIPPNAVFLLSPSRMSFN